MKSSKEIRKMRMEMGKFLHNYYVKFGDDKYEKFLAKLGSSMQKDFGEPFSSDNLRIMEAEFVTFDTVLNGKTKNSKNTKS